MSRNLNDGQSDAFNVPIGGTVTRGIGSPTLVTTSDGRVYLAPNQTAALSITEYPKFIDILSSYDSVSNGVVLTQAGTASVGNIKLLGFAPIATQVNSAVGSFNSPIVFGDDELFRSTNTIGDYVLAQQKKPGGASTILANAFIVNTANQTTAFISASSAGCWYDSSTTSLRNISYINNAWRLVTTTNGTALTTTNITFSADNFGLPTTGGFYTTTAGSFFLASNAVVFASSFSVSPKFWVSTDSGVNFTDITTAVGGATAAEVANYNGTTFFLVRGTTANFSTDNGVSFTNSTTGGTTSLIAPPTNAFCKTKGSSSSQFIWIGQSGSLPRAWFTSDGGQNITTTNLPTTGLIVPSTVPTLTSLAYAGGVWCYSYFDPNATARGAFVGYSSDNGATWAVVQVAPEITASTTNHRVASVDGVFYLVTTSSIYKSTNGSSWTQVWSGVMGVGEYYKIYGITDYVICGEIVVKKSDASFIETTVGMVNGITSTFPIKLRDDVAIRIPTVGTAIGNYLTSATSDKIRFGAPNNDATAYTTGFPFTRIR